MNLKLSEQSKVELIEAKSNARSGMLPSLKQKPAVFRLERPVDLQRAKSFGYRSVPGYAVVVSRVPRGGRRKPRPRSGRRPRHAGSVLYTPSLDRAHIATQRAAKHFKNMRPLGQHRIAEDGKAIWFEVIFVDRSKQ